MNITNIEFAPHMSFAETCELVAALTSALAAMANYESDIDDMQIIAQLLVIAQRTRYAALVRENERDSKG